MNTKQFAFAVLITIFPFAASATAQAPDNAIYLGNVKLTLGESQQVVIAKLAEEYNLGGRFKSEGVWEVFPKNVPPDEPGSVPVGSVTFKDGKLRNISREWGPSDPERGAEFARALYSAIADLAKDRRGGCIVTVGQQRFVESDPKAAPDDAILLDCGARHVRIYIHRLEQGRETASIEEFFPAPSFEKK